MKKLKLNTKIISHISDGHPTSEIIGIDHYTMQNLSGDILTWPSYTMVPSNPDDRKGIYERWYIVDMPKIGLSFVKLLEESDIQPNLDIDSELTGSVSIKSEGDAELGTGEGHVTFFFNKESSSDDENPKGRYAKETFADGTSLYFQIKPFNQKPTL